jgi:hypothetical protein
MSQPLAVVPDFALIPDTLRWFDLPRGAWDYREAHLNSAKWDLLRGGEQLIKPPAAD